MRVNLNIVMMFWIHMYTKRESSKLKADTDNDVKKMNRKNIYALTAVF